MGRKSGELINLSDRKNYCELIETTCAKGAKQKDACKIVGITARTYQRWIQNGNISADKRLNNNIPKSNKLSGTAKQEIIEMLNKKEYRSLTPHQIVPMLLDIGRYLASESTFYRIMREHNLLKHRSKSTPVVRKKPQELIASRVNQIYTWDITYLNSLIKGQYYYLYMFMDIYSRKIVGWQVHDCESSSHAAELVQDIAFKENITKDSLVIHSDNGSPMKGSTLRAKLIDLCIAPSFSRPRVSNDNPFSESLFKTLKYHCSYPEQPFESLQAARKWVDGFVNWYNQEHRHSSIKFVTPNQRHAGIDTEILRKRKEVIERAKKSHPQRWNGRETRNLEHIKAGYLNPENEIGTAKYATGEQRIAA